MVSTGLQSVPRTCAARRRHVFADRNYLLCLLLFPLKSESISITKSLKKPAVSTIGKIAEIAAEQKFQIKHMIVHAIKNPGETTYCAKNMGMGTKKSTLKVMTNDAIHAILKALRSFDGSSSIAISVCISFSSSRTVGRSRLWSRSSEWLEAAV